MKEQELEQKAVKQYNEADWSNVFNDWCKESYDRINFDIDWLHSCFRAAYNEGFKEGFLTAQGTKKDKYGNFITHPEDDSY
jgi:hypothetical protein